VIFQGPEDQTGKKKDNIQEGKSSRKNKNNRISHNKKKEINNGQKATKRRHAKGTAGVFG